MARPVAVDLLHFNDLHRKLQPLKDGSGGVVRLSTAIKRLQAEHPDAPLLNLGDLCGDNTAHTPQHFDPIPEIFNHLGVDIVALGNHELEAPWGQYRLLREGFIKKFDGDTLCANVRLSRSGQPIEGTRDYVIRQLCGVNVAFIGVVTTELASAVFPAAGAGLSTMSIGPALDRLVRKVRQEGADAVVVLAHEGIKDMANVARKVDGIDLILAAHDHRATPEPEMAIAPSGKAVPIIEAGAYGQFVGHTRLLIDTDSKRVVGVESRLHPVNEDTPADAEMEAILARYPGPGPQVPVPKPKKWETVESFEELKQRLEGQVDLAA